MDKTTSILIRYMALLSALIIAAMPFHAFLTVWASSLAGHYTLLRLWKELVLLTLVFGAVFLVCTRAQVRQLVIKNRLVQLVVAYGLALIICGGIAMLVGTVNRKAFAYGLLLDGRFLAFFCVTWLVSSYTDLLVRYWKRILLAPAAIVVGFVVLQRFLLPADFLKHFGYGPKTISPIETVDQKAAYRRVQSFMRGANPLGAYLVLIISALGVLITRTKKQRWPTAVLFVLSCLALALTFSRSAWLGALASLALLLWLSVCSRRTRYGLVLAAAAALIAFGALTYALRHNDRFQNIFFHTSNHSQSSTSSNSGHAAALKNGVTDVLHQPWGGGTGTAGPASVYNSRPARIAENYYVQIAQETGIIGLGLFMAINILVALRLWQQRASMLARVLFVSFIGLVVVNMLLHAWADDTLAYVWWGLAGAVCAVPFAETERHETAE